MKPIKAPNVTIISQQFEQLPEDKKKELTSTVTNTIETYKKSLRRECKNDRNLH